MHLNQHVELPDCYNLLWYFWNVKKKNNNNMLIFSSTYKCVCVFIILYAYFFERKYSIWINSYALVTDLKAMGCISSFFSELSQRILDKLASLMASTCAEKLIPKLQFPKTNLFQITTYIIMFWKVEFEMYILRYCNILFTWHVSNQKSLL